MSLVASPSPDRDWLLRLRGIHKHFPGVHALKGIDLDVRPGEVHAVVGGFREQTAVVAVGLDALIERAAASTAAISTG